MVAACRQRFVGAPWLQAHSFAVGDARALPGADHAFDIVLFSFNGLDSLSAEGRAQALRECHRVLRPGGWFVYSGHNLNWLDRSGAWPPGPSWRERLEQALYRRKMRRLNRDHDSRADAAMLRDPPGGIGIHYARPRAHLRELAQTGFVRPRVFDRGGREHAGAAAEALCDAWVYYLCEKAPVAA